ncbi:MAG: SGNH/GDSL hydrolase family protein [Pseudomonadota bacterium]
MSENDRLPAAQRAAPVRRKLGLVALVLQLGVAAMAVAGCGGLAREPIAAPSTPTLAPRAEPAAVPIATPPAGSAAPAAVASASPQRCVVEVYGDSIVASNGSSERPLAALQRKYTALRWTDHAVPAVQLTALAKYFDESPRTGRWVVIENGVIDAWFDVKPAVFVQTLKHMVERVRAEGREPVLTGFSRQVESPKVGIHKAQLIRRDQYDLLVRRLAQTLQVPFVDWGAVRFEGAGDLLDGVHPGLAYSNRLLERLGETLDKVSGCK